MYSEKITYTDYNGEERTEVFYFNLTKAELADMTMSVNGGFENYVQLLISEKDISKLKDVFCEIIRKSYGIKSLDGKYFRKSPEAFEDFKSTEAYSEMFMKFFTEEGYAAKFINAIIPDIPDDLRKEAMARVNSELA